MTYAVCHNTAKLCVFFSSLIQRTNLKFCILLQFFFLFECKSGDIRINVQKYLSYSDNLTRSSCTLKLLSCRTSLFRDSFFVKIVHLWNALPDSIKFTRLKNVFVMDNVRSYKIICPKCRKINAMSICNC